MQLHLALLPGTTRTVLLQLLPAPPMRLPCQANGATRPTQGQALWALHRDSFAWRVVVCKMEQLRCWRLVNSRRPTAVCFSHSSPSAFGRSSMCLMSWCLVLWLHSVSSWPAPCLCGRGQTRREWRKDNPVSQARQEQTAVLFPGTFFFSFS